MKLHNTLSRQIEELKPLNPGKVKIYTCGVTVYDHPHIGNWVGYIYWDVLVRTLEYEGYEVERTQNYTDVGHLVSDDDSGEDKMEKGARKEGLTAWDVAEKYIKIADHEAYDVLGLKKPTYLKRATNYIPEQIKFVADLEKLGYTYEIPDEGIYFDTSKLQDYGKLARLDIAGLQAGARVSVDGKRNATDFALWKFSPKNEKRDMEWESPWGKGFPGWHLECSVIARETLGDRIDIHTGGIDHIPVHHTNEIAQTESLTKKVFSNIWVHNNHIKVDGNKMSKSLGNIYTLEDIVDHGYSIEAYKLMILSKHYQTEGNFTWENLEAAQNRLHNLKRLSVMHFQPRYDESNDISAKELSSHTEAVVEALKNDLDTPTALIHITAALEMYEDGILESQIEQYKDFLSTADNLLGLHLSTQKDITDEQRAIIAERETARSSKDWNKSDELRNELHNQGIGIRDTANGTIWFWL